MFLLFLPLNISTARRSCMCKWTSSESLNENHCDNLNSEFVSLWFDFLDGVFILGRVVFSFPGMVCSGLFPRTCANKVLWFCERSINIDANHLKMLPAALFSSLIELPRWRP